MDHPGAYIQDELAFREWEPETLARLIPCGLDEIDALLEGRLRINIALAKGLADAFGTSTEFWLNLQRRYDEANVMPAKNLAEELAHIKEKWRIEGHEAMCQHARAEHFQAELARFRHDYSLFEECSPPDVPRPMLRRARAVRICNQNEWGKNDVFAVGDSGRFTRMASG